MPSKRVEEARRQVASAAAQVGDASLSSPIGVPPDYVVTRDQLEIRDPFGSVAQKAKHEQITPRYFDGDDWAPASLPPVKIRQLQQDMIAAGLIPKGAEYRIGYWDDTSRLAYRQLLGEANGSGFSARQQLMMRQNTEDTNRKTETAVYLRPDPATVRGNVRQLMRSYLGEDREPSSKELEALGATFEQFNRQAFNAQVAADVAQTAGTGGTVQDVDPSAQFEEFFRQRYQPEIQHQRDVVDMSKSRESLLGNVFALDQYIGR